jgi:hypothetical protein
MVLPCTGAAIHATHTVINITDELEPDSNVYTNLITEQAPLPLQDTIVPSQPTSPKLMQRDIPYTSENMEEPITLIIVALSQPDALSISIPVTLPKSVYADTNRSP